MLAGCQRGEESALEAPVAQHCERWALHLCEQASRHSVSRCVKHAEEAEMLRRELLHTQAELKCTMDSKALEDKASQERLVQLEATKAVREKEVR